MVTVYPISTHRRGFIFYILLLFCILLLQLIPFTHLHNVITRSLTTNMMANDISTLQSILISASDAFMLRPMLCPELRTVHCHRHQVHLKWLHYRQQFHRRLLLRALPNHQAMYRPSHRNRRVQPSCR